MRIVSAKSSKSILILNYSPPQAANKVGKPLILEEFGVGGLGEWIRFLVSSGPYSRNWDSR